MPKRNEKIPDRKVFNWCLTLEDELQMTESLRKQIAGRAPEGWGTERMYTFGNRVSEGLEEGEGYEW